MGLTEMVFSAIAAFAGAIMYWAVSYQGTSNLSSSVGRVLTIAGGLGVVSSIAFATSRRQVGAGAHTMDRHVTDSRDGSHAG